MEETSTGFLANSCQRVIKSSRRTKALHTSSRDAGTTLLVCTTMCVSGGRACCACMAWGRAWRASKLHNTSQRGDPFRSRRKGLSRCPVQDQQPFLTPCAPPNKHCLECSALSSVQARLCQVLSAQDTLWTPSQEDPAFYPLQGFRRVPSRARTCHDAHVSGSSVYPAAAAGAVYMNRAPERSELEHSVPQVSNCLGASIIPLKPYVTGPISPSVVSESNLSYHRVTDSPTACRLNVSTLED